MRRHCRVDAEYDDDLLTGYAIAARVMAEAWTNRAFITQKLRYTITNAPPPYSAPLVPQSLLVLPLNWPAAGFLRPIPLLRAPCQTLDAVNWGYIGELQPAPSDQYTLNNQAAPAMVNVSAGIAPMISTRSIQFDYTAGYGDDPAAVPPLIKQGILMLTAAFYENRGDVAVEACDAAYALLGPYRLFQFAG